MYIVRIYFILNHKSRDFVHKSRTYIWRRVVERFRSDHTAWRLAFKLRFIFRNNLAFIRIVRILTFPQMIQKRAIVFFNQKIQKNM